MRLVKGICIYEMLFFALSMVIYMFTDYSLEKVITRGFACIVFGFCAFVIESIHNKEVVE